MTVLYFHQCERSFTDRSHLENHVKKSHRGEALHMLSMWNEFNRANLEYYMRLHTGEGAFHLQTVWKELHG